MKLVLKLAQKFSYLLLLLSVLVPSTSWALGTEDSLGRSRLKQSLNKRITVTRRGTWTEHTGANTGIDVITTVCPTRYRNFNDKKSKDFDYYNNQVFGYFVDKYTITGRCSKY